MPPLADELSGIPDKGGRNARLNLHISAYSRKSQIKSGGAICRQHKGVPFALFPFIPIQLSNLHCREDGEGKFKSLVKIDLL